MRHWEIISVAETAYKHGQAYAKGQIMRSTNKYYFKMPHVIGLPNYVINMNYDDHKLLENVYKHAFRAGFRSTGE